MGGIKMLLSILQMVAKFLVGYTISRCTKEFNEWLVDFTLTKAAERTDNKWDDDMVKKFISKGKE